MGQKVHPYGFRLGITTDHVSRWFSDSTKKGQRYADFVAEDVRIREFLKKELDRAGIARIEIERTRDRVRVDIHSARPGIVIGRRGAEAERIRDVIGAALVAGANITITVDDPGDTITIAASGGGGGGVWTLVETLTPSAVASIDSEAWVGAGYKELRFLFNLVFGTDGDHLGLRYKLAGTYRSTNDYRYSAFAASSSGTSASEGSASATGAVITRTGGTWGIGNAALEKLSGDARMVLPESTGKPKSVIADLAYNVPSGQLARLASAAFFEGTNNSDPLEGLRIYASLGTMTGTIEVYGLS
jgi:predicted RNA-binding protein YlqC (UPF0109 family)